MRKRIFHWQGQRFVYLSLEAEPGASPMRQAEGVFARAGAELAALGLSLVQNTVRTRIFGRTREARSAGSEVRAVALTGTARAAGSSYVSPGHFASAADVALDLFAMAAPVGGGPRQVTEHAPVQNFIRHLIWGRMVFLAGMTCEEPPTLEAQSRDILLRAGALLRETGCDWRDVVRVSAFLHRQHDAETLLAALTAAAPVPLDNAEVEFVDGFSRPGKLIEIEITARR